MKLIVRIEEQIFEVEIQNLHTSPVIAIVDGEKIEVWPENLLSTAPASSAIASPPNPAANPVQPAVKTNGSQVSPLQETKWEIRAPIPGTVVAVKVMVGDQVNPGDELCVIEAMKMKNMIRANRAGTVTRIFVQVGQTVKHQDLLMESTD